MSNKEEYKRTHCNLYYSQLRNILYICNKFFPYEMEGKTDFHTGKKLEASKMCDFYSLGRKIYYLMENWKVILKKKT